VYRVVCREIFRDRRTTEAARPVPQDRGQVGTAMSRVLDGFAVKQAHEIHMAGKSTRKFRDGIGQLLGGFDLGADARIGSDLVEQRVSGCLQRVRRRAALDVGEIFPKLREPRSSFWHMVIPGLSPVKAACAYSLGAEDNLLPPMSNPTILDIDQSAADIICDTLKTLSGVEMPNSLLMVTLWYFALYFVS
jgi:hypothetical protein